MAPVDIAGPIVKDGKLEKKPISYVNLAVGAGLNMFEVSTLGQPFEVIKTHLAANRKDSILLALKKTFKRGGILGFYQGLIPWAWIEASTKGAVLIFTASDIEYRARVSGASPFLAGIVGGMGGGLAQAYTTMGFCTFMKTVEVTRHKAPSGQEVSTLKVASDIWKKEGIRGINKGVNAVAVRQCTNWASRFGLTRAGETLIRRIRDGDVPDYTRPLSPIQKILASAIGGGLSCWNQPIEVIRVEMQSQVKSAGRPEKMTIFSCAKFIYKNNGLKGFYRGVIPRMGLGIWQTVCMVFGGDAVKAKIAQRQAAKI
ncbi:8414_t:CDS:2 [Funneliformis geosporum]|uniref:19529_t:CDS:1 n=1 Tax=Funneliformis geosporum TaxID=1117311 RepID=A0A9W4T1W3_9GLOM|nr:19529_t:CDS:2 [Funneliformis geosporum]CAI2189112.1 8414_t:CDS:2 [Funneliformis geosporum]